jgi:L-arabinose isomerase
MRFRVKGGHVTLLSLFADVERFKLVVARGTALAGPDKLEGSPHAVIRLATPLPTFFERVIRTGSTQHWALVHDDVVPALRCLAEILGLDFVEP